MKTAAALNDKAFEIYWHVLDNKKNYYESLKPLELFCSIVEHVSIDPFDGNGVYVGFYGNDYWCKLTGNQIIHLHNQVESYKNAN